MIETVKLAMSEGYEVNPYIGDSGYFCLCDIQRWLIDKRKICITIFPHNDEEAKQILYESLIVDLNDCSAHSTYNFTHSYEECLEEALNEALKNIS
jgi:hypothetical protein